MIIRSKITRLTLPTVMVVCTLGTSLSFGMHAPAYARDAAASQAGTNAHAALRSIKSATNRVQRATLQVVNDVGQRPVQIDIGDPRYWEPSDKQLSKDAKLWQDELAQFGPLEPPKKSWLDADMAHLKHYLEVLQQDIQGVNADASDPAVAAAWQQLQAAVSDAQKHLAELEKKTEGPKYDNLSIAASALAIRDDMHKIEKPWKTLYAAIKTKL